MIGNTTKMDRNGHRSNTRRQVSWVGSTTKRTGMDIGHPPVFKASGRKPNKNNELIQSNMHNHRVKTIQKLKESLTRAD